MLESKVVTLDTVIKNLEIKADSNEQYTRRYSLRLHNISYQPDESSSDLDKEVKTLYSNRYLL